MLSSPTEPHTDTVTFGGFFELVSQILTFFLLSLYFSEAIVGFSFNQINIQLEQRNRHMHVISVLQNAHMYVASCRLYSIIGLTVRNYLKFWGWADDEQF